MSSFITEWSGIFSALVSFLTGNPSLRLRVWMDCLPWFCTAKKNFLGIQIDLDNFVFAVDWSLWTYVKLNVRSYHNNRTWIWSRRQVLCPLRPPATPPCNRSITSMHVPVPETLFPPVLSRPRGYIKNITTTEFFRSFNCYKIILHHQMFRVRGDIMSGIKDEIIYMSIEIWSVGEVDK